MNVMRTYIKNLITVFIFGLFITIDPQNNSNSNISQDSNDYAVYLLTEFLDDNLITNNSKNKNTQENNIQNNFVSQNFELSKNLVNRAITNNRIQELIKDLEDYTDLKFEYPNPQAAVDYVSKTRSSLIEAKLKQSFSIGSHFDLTVLEDCVENLEKNLLNY